MKPRSIRFRLTAWYGCILAVTLAVCAAAFWVAMRESILKTVDHDLNSRLQVVSASLAHEANENTESELAEELEAQAATGAGGAVLRVADKNGIWIYSSPETRKWPIAVAHTGIQTLEAGGRKYRVLTAPMPRGMAQIGVALGQFDEALNTFTLSVGLVSPLLLLLASFGGYWISGRALRPVNEIVGAARRIGAENLSERLSVLGSGDELDRLSSTLNLMLARLETSFTRITQFTADASHELRTPLAIIQTTAEMSLARPRTVQEHERAWNQVLAQTERSSKLIEDLLMLARADAGYRTFTFEAVDLTVTLEQVCGEMQVVAQANEIQLHTSLPPTCPATVDPEAIRRLFLILLENAVKYTPSGGEIEVSINQTGDGTTIEVLDTGAGISPEDLPRIFDRFYRTGQDRSRRTGGAGLGLSIAQWIVSQHGGRICAESTLGRGSLLRVTLPPLSA